MAIERSQQQVLITGCYRTGTEYLTLLLNNHPELSATMYTVNFMRFCYGRYNPVEKKGNYEKLLSDAAKRIKDRWGRALDVGKILSDCQKRDKVTYAFLYDVMMSELFLKSGVKRWAEKTQLAWTKIPNFLDMYPETGQAIHVIRDPRSVLASFKYYTYAPEPAYLGAIFNCYGSMAAALKYLDTISKKKYLLVKYEDIAAHPKETLTKIFRFLNLSSKHDLLSQEGWADAKGEPWRHNSAFAGEKDEAQPFDIQSALKRWKKNLSEEETALCEYVNSEIMQKLGYAPSGNSADYSKLIKPVLEEKTLRGYYNHWVKDKEGVEEYPTDPLRPENWAENRT